MDINSYKKSIQSCKKKYNPALKAIKKEQYLKWKKKVLGSTNTTAIESPAPLIPEGSQFNFRTSLKNKRAKYLKWLKNRARKIKKQQG